MKPTGPARKRVAAQMMRRDDAPKRKNFLLHQSALDAARRVLGTRTETETVERALDLIAFGERLAAGTERSRWRPWSDIFGAPEDSGSGAER